MKKLTALCIILCCWYIARGQYTTADVHNYIATYSATAVQKMNEFGIPASITLAQGILESGAGTSDLARIANNHFGIKCHSDWTGKKYYKDDDKKDDCFRSYANAAQSYDDHSKFLQQNRYKSLFTLDKTDYKAWAKGLKACGYATNPQYAERLIKLIEDYELYKYDTGATGKKQEALAAKNERKTAVTKKNNTTATTRENNTAVTPKSSSATTASTLRKNDWVKRNNAKRSSGSIILDEFNGSQATFKGFSPVEYPYTSRPVYKNNGVYFVVAKSGETYYSIAVDVQLGVGELKLYNEVPNRKYEPYAGEVVYLGAKKNKAEMHTHMVRPGETMRDVAQLYGVKSAALYRINQLDKNTDLVPGQKLKLR